MKRYVIHCKTDWYGMEQDYGVEADSELELEDIAEQLSYYNWESYGGPYLHAALMGYNTTRMEEEDWNTVYDDVAENPSYGYFIEEFNGTEEEWNELDNPL